MNIHSKLDDGITISEYVAFIIETDRLPKDDLSAVLHGLFGEVGGLMSAAKKVKREPGVYTGFDSVVIEEFGDAFWYLCCLAVRLRVDIESVFIDVTQGAYTKSVVLKSRNSSPLTIAYRPSSDESFDTALISLGQLTGSFLSEDYVCNNPAEKVKHFLEAFFKAITALNINFGDVIRFNILKASGRFIRPDNASLPTFDSGCLEYEQLPRKFEIEYVQRTKSHQAMRLNGVFIGDPLTDSIKDKDGYRFHDVFHFSYAAILHWSPTFRALLKHKRKNDPETDESQDGGRAIVVEEGLAAWIFTIAKENDFFENRSNLTFDMLKNVAQFVKGFEVDRCPLILWEEAILKGYEVFRMVKKNNGGIVIGDLATRSISYKRSN